MDKQNYYLIAHGFHTPEQSRKIAAKTRRRIIRKHGSRCLICGYKDSTSGDLLVVHHIVPVESGGHGGASNLLPICRNCHAVVHRFADPKLCHDGKWFARKSFNEQVEIIMTCGYTDPQAQAMAILATEAAWFDGRRLWRNQQPDPIETEGRSIDPPCTSLMTVNQPNGD